MDLFSEENKEVRVDLPNAEIYYHPEFLRQKDANNIYQRLLNETSWQRDDIKVFGKVYAQPRLTALYGEEGKSYSYSGIVMQPQPFTPLLKSLKERIESIYDAKYTTVLLNLYRDGRDSNGWHSDDEKELGQNPVIASLSLGAVRRFHLKHKSDDSLKRSIDLAHGSLLIMAGKTQHYWKHQLSKTARVVEPRINLTFRRIVEG